MLASDPGVAEEVRVCATHSPYCSVQSSTNLQSEPTVSWDVMKRAFPTNHGGLCQKGWTSAELLNNPERPLNPLVRSARPEPLWPPTWDEALDRIILAIERTQRLYGSDSVGTFGGGGLTNEKAYLLDKFARRLRTSQIEYYGRFFMSSAAPAAIEAFGIVSSPPCWLSFHDANQPDVNHPDVNQHDAKPDRNETGSSQQYSAGRRACLFLERGEHRRFSHAKRRRLVRAGRMPASGWAFGLWPCRRDHVDLSAACMEVRLNDRSRLVWRLQVEDVP